MMPPDFTRILTEAPAVTPEVKDNPRVAYFRQKLGQLVGWMTHEDEKFLVDWLPQVALAYKRYPMRIVEIGTFLGSTARGLIGLSGGGTITCVDNWRDVHESNPRAAWEKTLRSNGMDLLAHATLIEGDVRAIGATWAKNADLLLVDADHSYESASADLRDFGARVVHGGYCLVDDLDLPDVEKAAKEFFVPRVWEVIRFPMKSEGKLGCWRRKALL